MTVYRLNKQSIPFTQVSNKVIQTTTYPLAAFVWIYLLSKPQDWRVIKKEIKNHFNLGNDAIKKIFAYLTRTNLITQKRERKLDGTMGDTVIDVLSGELFSEENQEVKELSTKSTRGSKNQPLVFPAAGFQATTNKDLKTNKEKTTKRYPVDKKSKAIFADPESQSTCYKKPEKPYSKIPLSSTSEQARLNALKAVGINPKKNNLHT